MSSNASGADEDVDAARSLRDVRQVKTEKKMVGRPRLYSGDPDAPHLTSAERSCMKRRAGNRESARRVRTRRQDTIDGMTAHLQNLEEENEQLSQRASSLDEVHAPLKSQRSELRQHLHVANMENYGLKREVSSLRDIAHAASDWQSAEAGYNDARGDMPAAGPLGNQHGYIVDVNGNINPILPHLMTSDTQSVQPGLGNGLTFTFTEGGSDAFVNAPAANGLAFDVNEGSNAHLGIPTSMLECLVPNDVHGASSVGRHNKQFVRHVLTDPDWRYSYDVESATPNAAKRCKQRHCPCAAVLFPLAHA